MQDRAFQTEVQETELDYDNSFAFKIDTQQDRRSKMSEHPSVKKAAPQQQIQPVILRNSMTNQSFVHELEYDSDEIRHHCHSDLDEDEHDPYFEYNRCNQFEYLEKKIEQDKFIPISLNQFGIRYAHSDQAPCDLLQELDNIIKRKYLHAMQQLVNPDPIIDSKEERTFNNYLNKDDTRLPTQQLIDINAFVNYFSIESKANMGSALNSSQMTEPLYKSNDYREFPTPTSMTGALQNDLEPFYEY